MATKKSTKKSQQKVGKAMHEFKRGQLKSGGRKRVTSRKQAIAIGLSEARREGANIPRKGAANKRAGAKKAGGKKTAAKKSTAKRGGAKKTASRGGARKTASKKR
jgi:hypothetical protein